MSGFRPVNIAIVTVSDTRSRADDKSGDTLAQRVTEAGHTLIHRSIVRDEFDDGFISDGATERESHLFVSLSLRRSLLWAWRRRVLELQWKHQF